MCRHLAYVGEPITLAAEVGAMQGRLTITGTVAGRPWTTELPLRLSRRRRPHSNRTRGSSSSETA